MKDIGSARVKNDGGDCVTKRGCSTSRGEQTKVHPRTCSDANWQNPRNGEPAREHTAPYGDFVRSPNRSLDPGGDWVEVAAGPACAAKRTLRNCDGDQQACLALIGVSGGGRVAEWYQRASRNASLKDPRGLRVNYDLSVGRGQWSLAQMRPYGQARGCDV